MNSLLVVIARLVSFPRQHNSRAIAFGVITLWLTLTISVATAQWQEMPVPTFWERQHGGPLEGDHNGYAWYRCFFKVPAAWQDRELTLSLGAIDDCDQSYFNGRQIGALGTVKPYQTASSLRRQYKVASKLVKPGQWNMIAVRVYDGGGGGGIWQGPIEIRAAASTIQLAGTWQFRVDDEPSFATPPTAGLEAVASAFAKKAGQKFGQVLDFGSLPGTKLLNWDGDDFSPRMRAGIHKFLDRKTVESVDKRSEYWQRDTSSPLAYEKSIAQNRARLTQYIGATDALVKGDWSMQGVGQD
ncbi:MAG: hypothetical protein ACI9G1_003211, partial [Pirellulaceae bacterium]